MVAAGTPRAPAPTTARSGCLGAAQRFAARMGDPASRVALPPDGDQRGVVDFDFGQRVASNRGARAICTRVR
jgi:hypothetical protein